MGNPKKHILLKIWDTIFSKYIMGIMTLFSLGFALFTYYNQPIGNLEIQIEKYNKIYNIYKDVGGLSISFEGVDLKKTNMTLWSFTISVKNKGGKGITLSDFDPRSPLKINIINGVIVGEIDVYTTSGYLKNNFAPKNINNEIIFPTAIIDSGEYLYFDVLILGDIKRKPQFVATGKISGIANLSIHEAEENDGRKTLWSLITEADSFYIQILRSIIYLFPGFFVFVFSILIFAMLASIFAYIPNKIIEKRKIHSRKLNIEGYIPKKDKFIFDKFRHNYISSGDKSIVSILESSKKLLKRLKYIKTLNTSQTDINDIAKVTQEFRFGLPDISIVQNFIDDKSINKNMLKNILNEGYSLLHHIKNTQQQRL